MRLVLPKENILLSFDNFPHRGAATKFECALTFFSGFDPKMWCMHVECFSTRVIYTATEPLSRLQIANPCVWHPGPHSIGGLAPSALSANFTETGPNYFEIVFARLRHSRWCDRVSVDSVPLKTYINFLLPI